MSLTIAAIVIGLGFVSAAFLYTADTALRGRPSYLVIQSPSLFKVAGTFFFCMFVGPYITAERGIVFWLEGKITNAMLAVCGVVSVLWSFCAGVFVAQLLMVTGLVQV